MPDSAATTNPVRRQNWIAIAAATPVMMFSYFSYAAAFVDDGGSDTDGIEPALAAIGLAIAPFVFVVLAFVSKNADAGRRVLHAMGLLLVVGLSIGLIDPVLGATTGFASGGAIALTRPRVERVITWRVAAVIFTGAYCLVLLIVASAGGVFAGGVVPLLMIGAADEYATFTTAA